MPITRPLSPTRRYHRRGHTCFDRKPRYAMRQHVIAITRRLGVEGFDARHRDDAQLDIFRGENLACLDRGGNFGPGRDHDRIGLAILRIDQHITAERNQRDLI